MAINGPWKGYLLTVELKQEDRTSPYWISPENMHLGQLNFSVQLLSHVRLFVTPWIAALQASLSITNSDSYPSSQWCHPAISSSVVPFSSCLQSLPASESFPMSQLFTWGGQSIGVSALASVLPLNIQDWFPLGLTGLISRLGRSPGEGDGNPLQ